MSKEFKNYFLNIIKKESFYIDIISMLIGCVIIAVTAVSFYTGEAYLVKVVFALALVITVMNWYKSFKALSPMRYVYAACSVVLIGMCVYSLFTI
jgi:hypothetical protein